MKQSSWLRRLVEDTGDHPYIILDSGAYSVWRSGAKVDATRYLAYCATVREEVLTCVNLDIIPGRWGQRATPHQVEDACRASFDQWVLLRTSGALVMPVFHQTDDLAWLYRYIDAGAEYIGISPTDSFSATQRQKWLVDVHDDMVQRGIKLNQEVFTHALGVFAPRILHGIPLWSADASTLLRYCAMKRILVPQNKDGKITGWEAVYVGARASHTSTDNVDWTYVRNYLDSIGHQNSYTLGPSRRVLIDDFCTTISISLNLARRAMHESGVRCFVAGNLPLAIWQVCVAEKYPYILRSFAVIKENHGNTIKNLYLRTISKPPRRPERDHKVVPTRGLFT